MGKGASAMSLGLGGAAALTNLATRPTVHLATGSWAVKCLIALSGAILMKSVSIWTI
jgi:hypothetical protein